MLHLYSFVLIKDLSPSIHILPPSGHPKHRNGGMAETLWAELSIPGSNHNLPILHHILSVSLVVRFFCWCLILRKKLYREPFKNYLADSGKSLFRFINKSWQLFPVQSIWVKIVNQRWRALTIYLLCPLQSIWVENHLLYNQSALKMVNHRCKALSSWSYGSHHVRTGNCQLSTEMTMRRLSIWRFL